MYELALPLFVVRYDAVVTSYLGETAQRLRRLFDFVRTEPCVLFFDEFDAIGEEDHAPWTRALRDAGRFACRGVRRIGFRPKPA